MGKHLGIHISVLACKDCPMNIEVPDVTMNEPMDTKARSGSLDTTINTSAAPRFPASANPQTSFFSTAASTSQTNFELDDSTMDFLDRFK